MPRHPMTIDYDYNTTNIVRCFFAVTMLPHLVFFPIPPNSAVLIGTYHIHPRFLSYHKFRGLFAGLYLGVISVKQYRMLCYLYSNCKS